MGRTERSGAFQPPTEKCVSVRGAVGERGICYLDWVGLQAASESHHDGGTA